jgi:hypothetical protein
LVGSGAGAEVAGACSLGRLVLVGETSAGVGDAVGVTVGEKVKVTVGEGVEVMVAVGELVTVGKGVAEASNLGDRSILNTDVAAPKPVLGITKSGS